MAASMDVHELLKLYSSLQLFDEDKKVKCTLTGHEMPCKPDVIQSYVNGKKFKKFKEKQEYDDKLFDYKQHLVPSNKKNHENQLFCKLTWRHLNNTPTHIERHISGRRFKKAKAEWEECQKTGKTFKPRGGQTRKNTDFEGKRGSWEDKFSDDEEKEIEDDLSDLYPAEDFEVSESDEEAMEEDEINDMESDEDEVDSDNDSETAPQKRKKAQPVTKTKKQKTKNFKTKPKQKNFKKKTKGKT